MVAPLKAHFIKANMKSSNLITFYFLSDLDQICIKNFILDTFFASLASPIKGTVYTWQIFGHFLTMETTFLTPSLRFCASSVF